MIFPSFRGAVCCTASLLLAVLLAACATPPSDPAQRAVFEQTNDPLEPLNRKTLDLNLFLDRILFKPVTKIYIAIVPEEGRDAVMHALDNMKEPVVVINNVLQGRLEGAGIAVGRFAVNSTLGIAGLMDLASKWGLDKQSGDLGQTLFVWGFPGGPYLVVPILGPSNPRDLVGMAGDNYLDPFSYLASAESLDDISISRFVLGGIDQRARVIDVLDDLQKNSLDFYAQLRSLAQQRRAAELRHGKVAEPGPNFYQDPGTSPGASPTSPPTSASPAPAAGPGADFYQDPGKPPGASPPTSPPPSSNPAPAAGPGAGSYQDPDKPPAKPAASRARPRTNPPPAAAKTTPQPTPAPAPAPAAAAPEPAPVAIPAAPTTGPPRPAGPIAAATQAAPRSSRP